MLEHFVRKAVTEEMGILDGAGALLTICMILGVASQRL